MNARGWMHALALAALAVASAGCLVDFEPGARVLGEDRERTRGEGIVERQRAYYDEAATRPRSDAQVMRWPDGREVAHGFAREWHASGELASERWYDHGEPTGTWRTWREGGALASEATFGTREPAPMRWWHANGQLSSEGLALDGVRTGTWRTWHENGQLASLGAYLGGRREGRWEFFAPDGASIERGEFRADVRAGTWERGQAAPDSGHSNR